MKKILQLLEKGDMRTTGESDKVVQLVLETSDLFNELFQCLYSDNPGVRMRSADAIEKITSTNPELIQLYKSELFQIASSTNQQEVQWHMAQIFPYLMLNKSEINEAINILKSYYHESKSNIVKVMSMQSMFDLSKKQGEIKPEIKEIIGKAKRSDIPSIRSRANKLLIT